MTDRTSRSPDSSRRQFLGAGLAGLALAGAAGAKPATAGASADCPKRYQDKVVLITGATSGIGEVTAHAYAREGAKVFFCGRREKLGRQVEKAIRAAGGEATYMRADVREEQQMAAFVARCVEVYGGLDIAFNNAGLIGPAGNFEDLMLEGTGSYHDVMRTNVDGVFYAMRHELPVMRAAGSGVIVNNASTAAHRAPAQLATYAASKHAIIGLTRSAAVREIGNGIRVLSVSPGGTDTDILKTITGDVESMTRGGGMPIGRMAKPEEIAAVVLNITAAENVFLSGEDVRVDGAYAA